MSENCKSLVLQDKCNIEIFCPLVDCDLCYSLCLFVWFDSLRPINNLSVIKGRVFLGWTSTKLGLMCLAQGHNAVTPVRLEPAVPQSRVKHSLPLSHCAPYFNSDIRNLISHITFYSLMFFIAHAFKGQVRVLAGRMKIVSHSSCRTSAILKYFVPWWSLIRTFLIHSLDYLRCKRLYINIITLVTWSDGSNHVKWLPQDHTRQSQVWSSSSWRSH